MDENICKLTGGDWGDENSKSDLPSRIYLNVSRKWFHDKKLTIGQKFKITLERIEEWILQNLKN